MKVEGKKGKDGAKKGPAQQQQQLVSKVEAPPMSSHGPPAPPTAAAIPPPQAAPPMGPPFAAPVSRAQRRWRALRTGLRRRARAGGRGAEIESGIRKSQEMTYFEILGY